eukprot:3183796-Rhodomonas_salina.2
MVHVHGRKLAPMCLALRSLPDPSLTQSAELCDRHAALVCRAAVLHLGQLACRLVSISYAEFALRSPCMSAGVNQLC